MNTTLKQTSLLPLHEELGAKIVPFAGYQMPVQYQLGIIKEHLHTREKAGLFDVSHMGQIVVRGDQAWEKLETLMPVDLESLKVGRQRYGLFLNPEGGILDDLMIQNLGDEIILVVNAACKDADLVHLKQHLGDSLSIEMSDDRSLLALQGPTAATVLSQISGASLADMKFMDVRAMDIGGISTLVSRSGYTGEDGFEISVGDEDALVLARQLLEHEDVEAIGLGARDSLRLEAGLCLYGHDINTQTTPVEANLNWAISKARRVDGNREGGFPGADRILEQFPNQVSRRLVGIRPTGRAPVREGASIVDANQQVIGEVTSGGFSPSLGGPICLGYLAAEHTSEGSVVFAMVRNKAVEMTVTSLPFVPHRYYR